MINIAELLKDAKRGIKLYSPIFGPVIFDKIAKSNFPIVVKDLHGMIRSFTKCGFYYSEYSDSECMIYPGRDCRTWEGWKASTEPKFKVGDWIVRKNGIAFYGGNCAEQVTLVEGKCIWLSSKSWIGDDDIRHWTIQDARDGDVLMCESGWTCIFKKLNEDTFDSYCFMSASGDIVPDGSCCHTLDPRINGKLTPATVEQRSLFFKKLQEAGYQWYAGKKELKKIQSHYDTSNFCAGMPVLVRDKDNQKWCYLLYSHYDNTYEDGLCFNAGSVDWRQCIPFNENTKHLLGTADMCDEQYINW